MRNDNLRIIYMGSPDFAVTPLRILTEAGYEPLIVISRPDKPRGRGGGLAATPVKLAAMQIGLPVLTPNNVNDPDFLSTINGYKPDILLTVAYGQILKRELLQLPVLGAINLHASLLPAFRGAAPIHRAVINGENYSGVTTMYMNEELDAGDIILQTSCDIGAEETAGELHNKLMRLGADLLCRTINLIQQEKAPRQKQDSKLVSYAPPLKAEDEIIDWRQIAAAIHNRIRGLNPWPGAYCFRNGKRLKLWRSHIRPARFAAKPGEVVTVDRQGIWLATGEGELCLTEVQPEGKSVMEGCAFARGYAIEPGVMFVS